MGDSDGVFTSFESIAEDIERAVDEVAARMPDRKVVLVGLCDGASACAMYAAGDPRISAMVLLNPWVRSESGEAKARIGHYYGSRAVQLSFWRGLFTGETNLISSIVSFAENLRRSLSRSGEPPGFIERMLDGLNRFSGGILILLSETDLTAQEFLVLLRTSSRWNDALKKATITSINGADHTFSGEQQIERVASSVLQFVESQVGVAVASLTPGRET